MLKNIYNHFKKICIHKYWVFRFCCICGIPFQGIIHDLSKFSITEFYQNIKYYSDDISPVRKCKEEIGYSIAWQHHKGRNPHHNVYWTDNFDIGTTAIKMPKKYAIELICDYLGASMAYNKGSTIKDMFAKEYEFWQTRKDIEYMHPQTKDFTNTVIEMLYNNPNDYKKILKNIGTIWDNINEKYKDVPMNININRVEK